MILIIISKNLYEVGIQMLCQNTESGNKRPFDKKEVAVNPLYYSLRITTLLL